MAEPTTQNPPSADNKPTVDPYVAALAESFNKALDPSTGEVVVKPVNLEQPNPEKPAEPPPPPAEPKKEPDAPPAEPKKVVVRAKPTPPAVPTTAPAPTPEPVKPAASAEPAKPSAEEEFLKTLNPDQVDHLDIVSYAEKKNPALKGRRDETLAFYKKVQEFASKNPEVTPDSDEFQDFLDSNRPKWKDGELKRYERDMIREAAAEDAERRAAERLKPQVQSLEQQLKAMRAEPIIEAEEKQFIGTLASEKIDGVDPVINSVAAKIKDAGFEAAAKEFPVEAPILQAGIEAAREYLQIAHEAKPFDQSNETHAWLNTFVAEQGKHFASQPANVTQRNGKAFVPLHQWAALPEADKARSWTFDKNDILRMIQVNSMLQIDAELKKLEASGFKRQVAAVKSETQPEQKTVAAPAVPPAQVSPKAGTSSAPGAAETKASSVIDPAISALVPGWTPK